MSELSSFREESSRLINAACLACGLRGAPGQGARPNCCLSGWSLSSHCLSTSAGAPGPSVCCSCRVGPELLRSPSPRCWFQPPAPPGLRTPLPRALLHEEARVSQGHGPAAGAMVGPRGQPLGPARLHPGCACEPGLGGQNEGGCGATGRPRGGS